MVWVTTLKTIGLKLQEVISSILEEIGSKIQIIKGDEKLRFDISVVTPELLKESFNLDSTPSHLTSVPDGEVVPISRLHLKPNETYTLDNLLRQAKGKQFRLYM